MTNGKYALKIPSAGSPAPSAATTRCAGRRRQTGPPSTCSPPSAPFLSDGGSCAGRWGKPDIQPGDSGRHLTRRRRDREVEDASGSYSLARLLKDSESSK